MDKVGASMKLRNPRHHLRERGSSDPTEYTTLSRRHEYQTDTRSLLNESLDSLSDESSCEEILPDVMYLLTDHKSQVKSAFPQYFDSCC
jgi:hypothetical protein